MNSILINNTMEFEKEINSLQSSLSRIKDIFQKENVNMNKIDNTDIWSGKTQQSITEKYDELKENFPVIEESLENYIKFLRLTLENYKNTEIKINTNIDNVQKNLMLIKNKRKGIYYIYSYKI